MWVPEDLSVRPHAGSTYRNVSAGIVLGYFKVHPEFDLDSELILHPVFNHPGASGGGEWDTPKELSG